MNHTERMKLFSAIDIYPVISSEFTNERPVLEVLKAIAEGGAKIVQLREKHLDKCEVYTLAVEYRRITAAHNMLLIINDHLDIALAVGADGVHLGQDDLPLEAARKIAPDLILGSSTHDIPEAIEAQKLGASYINIGPINSTNTKQLSYKSMGIEGLKEVAAVANIPFTVMGGIKADHIPQLVAAGADKIAMVTEVTMADDITKRVTELRKLF